MMQHAHFELGGNLAKGSPPSLVTALGIYHVIIFKEPLNVALCLGFLGEPRNERGLGA